MKWMVTGGAGFFGLHMGAKLVASGHEVVSFDRVLPAEHECTPGVSYVAGDVRDTAALARHLAGVDIVVHAAAALALAPPAEIAAVNAEGTRHVLECAARAGVQRLVFIGSTAIYGMPKQHPIYEDAPLDPMGPYGRAKFKAEQYCIAARGIETVRLRPKSFIGTGRLGIFQLLFDWIEYGKRIYVLGSGRNVFQLLEVRDLVNAVERAALNGRNGHVYNIGAAEYGTVNDDVGALLAHAATGSRIVHVPSRPAKAALAFLEALHLSPVYRWVYDTADQDSFVSIEKARTELGWQPALSNQDALIGTYDWYLREGKALAQATGTSHRVAWKQGALKLLKWVS